MKHWRKFVSKILKRRKPLFRPRFFAFLKHVSFELMIFWLSFALVVFVLAVVFKPFIEQWLLDFFIRAQQQTELRQQVPAKTEDFALPPIEPVSPISPTPRQDSGQVSPISPISKTPLQGSFTELFSGVGWKNPLTSTVHQDFNTLTVSFPPAYTLEEVTVLTQALAGRRIVAAKGNRKEVFFVTSAGDIGLFDSNESIRFINSIGDFDSLAVDYDEASRAWFLVNVSDGKTEIIELSGGSAVIEIPAALNRLDLNCLNSHCLLVVDQDLFGLSKTFGGWDVKEISLPYEVHSVGIGKTNSDFLVGLVRKSGEQYEGDLYEIVDGAIGTNLTNKTNGPLFSSQYPGEVYFGFNDESGDVLALYAAYEGQAYKINFQFPISNFQITEDYSRFFTVRVMKEGGVRPDIFYKSGLSAQAGAWWISSTIGPISPKGPITSLPKFLRIRGGVGTDLTANLVRSNLTRLAAVPGFKENELYVIASDETSSRIYRFHDRGFKGAKKLVWESLRLNVWEGEIVRGRFTLIDDGEGGGNIKYFLSSNGGKNWEEAAPGELIKFETKGGDFRWKAELYPSKNQYESPWIKTIGVEYYIIRK